ncbi:30S ribosome-binding factor RbfA [Candidatus Enterovibrio altilux]|uniref:Ribosome-binding factor A n=1 Tax=Candidatus Enterovibrio altilux TaxID=1927128 RepID=A0A291BBD3_9GAMM|nr:30S ribosome-binding factor RbfA [Candidatus Enterovibrio luxaltus]ATF10291.1 Ribosome-binding factor A [Candidatus Enterovibrio luxaltus]
MAKEFSRTQRVSQQVQKAIALILQREIKDPRIGMVTVSGVDVSRDLSYAKVHVTFFTIGGQTVEDGLTVLNEQAWYVRILLGKAINLRIIPKVLFVFDQSLTEGIRISSLISRAITLDKKHRVDVNREEE